MTIQIVRICAVFCATLCIGSAIQLATTFAIPSFQLAFLDLGIFRSFTGLGLVETILLSALLSAFAEARFIRSDRSNKSHFQVESVALGFATGAFATLLILYFALRLPSAVVLAWGAQTALQLATAFATANAFEKMPLRQLFLSNSICLIVTAACLVVAYLFPTPIPNESFTIATKDTGAVVVDCFLPDTSGPYDAVVILHGVEGATNLTRRAIHYPNAKAVSQKGYATFFVRYFDACPYSDLLLMDEENQLDVAAIEEVRLRDYRRWIATAQEAIKSIRRRQDIEKLAVIGYSLGCYVGSAACCELCEQGYSPEAFVGNFGAIWPEVDIPHSFPPTQFYHGEEDEVIPIKDVQDSVARVAAVGDNEVTLISFPHQNHVPDGPVSPVMRTSTEAFLAKHLRAP